MQLVGSILLGLGLLLFIIYYRDCNDSYKDKSTTKIELELKHLKSQNSSNQTEVISTELISEITQLEKLSKLKEQGMLREEVFLQQKKEIIA